MELRHNSLMSIADVTPAAFDFEGVKILFQEKRKKTKGYHS